MKYSKILFLALTLFTIIILRYYLFNAYHKNTYSTSNNNWWHIINMFVSGKIVYRETDSNNIIFAVEDISHLNYAQVLKDKKHLFNLYKWHPLQINYKVRQKYKPYDEYLIGYYKNGIYYKMIIFPENDHVAIQHYISNNLRLIDHKGLLGAGPYFKIPSVIISNNH